VAGQSPAKANLLQGGQEPDGFFEPAPVGNRRTLGNAHDEQWFTRDAERMDELPNYSNQKKQQCHPKCTWTCGSQRCDTHCTPICKAPKCRTTCKKTLMSSCKRVCRDPQCAVVCPPQCEHGTCPQCKTVCSKPICLLNCGPRCESHCDDPDCVWDCKPDPGCAKPQCKLTCDAPPVCKFGKLQELPNEHEAPYLGQEVAWKGLGKIPESHFAELAPLAAEKNWQDPQPGKYFEKGPEALPPNFEMPSGDTGITKTASVSDVIRWTPASNDDQVNLPTKLTAAAAKNWKPVTFKDGRKRKKG